MISVKSRIIRILKNLNGYQEFSKDDEAGFPFLRTLDNNEHVIALYKDPHSLVSNTIWFTNERAFILSATGKSHIYYRDIEDVIVNEEKESAKTISIKTKNHEVVEITINFGDSRWRPVYTFLRLFIRLKKDVNSEKSHNKDNDTP